MSCKQRRDWARERSISFSAIERPLVKEVLEDDGLDPECTRWFVTSLLVRPPIARILSHFEEIDQPWYLNPRKAVYSHYDTSTDEWVQTYNVTYFAETVPIITDNYITRMLGGREAFEAPLGMVNEKHAARAMRTLRSVEWILDLAAPSNETDFVLQRGIGLAHGLVHSSEHTSSANAKMNPLSNNPNTTLSDKDRRWLDALNVYDDRIYKEAQTLQKLDLRSVQLMQGQMSSLAASTGAQQAGGGSRMPRTESCCGYACTPQR